MEDLTTTGEPSVFLRQASGLVKAAGLWDVFIYNCGLISVGIGVAYTQRFGPSYYPDGRIPVATILAGGLMCLVVFGFWAWTVTIPRSGGIYVFLTRAQHPAFGFALSFVECVSWLFYVAVAAKLITTVGLIPFVALLAGPDSGTVKLLSAPSGQLILGTVVLWLAAVLLISGTRVYLRAQRVFFAIAVIGTTALFIVMASPSAEATFHANFNRAFPTFGVDPYEKVFDQARTLGWEEESTNSLAADASLLVWPFLPLIGAAFSIGLGGEMRNTSRNQLLGMLGSLVVCTLAFVFIAVVGDRAIGTRFQGALVYNFDNPPGGGDRMHHTI